jgi:hypothetical protein
VRSPDRRLKSHCCRLAAKDPRWDQETRLAVSRATENFGRKRLVGESYASLLRAWNARAGQHRYSSENCHILREHKASFREFTPSSPNFLRNPSFQMDASNYRRLKVESGQPQCAALLFCSAVLVWAVIGRALRPPPCHEGVVRLWWCQANRVKL